MARKPIIPDLDATSLSQLAKQFPSTATPPLNLPVSAEPPAAETVAVVRPLPEPNPLRPIEVAALTPATTSAPGPVASPPASAPRAWRENIALRMTGVGLLAFLGGYLVNARPAGTPPATALVAPAPAPPVAAALAEAGAQLATLRVTRDRTISAGLALHDAAGSGRGFTAELQAARAAGAGLAPLGTVLDAMAPLATGVPNATMLGTRFETLAASALTIGQELGPTGWAEHLAAQIGALFTGDSRAATIDRRHGVLEATRAKLARGDLAGAVTLAAGLDPSALGAMEGWIAEARGRLALDALTDRAVALLTASAYRTLAAN